MKPGVTANSSGIAAFGLDENRNDDRAFLFTETSRLFVELHEIHAIVGDLVRARWSKLGTLELQDRDDPGSQEDAIDAKPLRLKSYSRTTSEKAARPDSSSATRRISISVETSERIPSCTMPTLASHS